jgi:hypothetical protein
LVNQERFFVAVLTALDECGIPYMVAGSVAAILYGEPRLTNDMDVVAALEPHRVDDLLACFSAEDFYVPSAESVRSVIAGGGSFNIIHVPSGSKVDLIVRRRTAFAAEEFSRRQRVPFTEGLDASVATPEDVIVSKLLYFVEGRSEKHLRDIAGILRVSAGRIDERYIESWVARLSLEQPWQAARRLAAAGD